MQAVEEAQRSVQEITCLMADDTTKEVFEHAKQSEENNSVGIIPWQYQDHVDWFKKDSDYC